MEIFVTVATWGSFHNEDVGHTIVYVGTSEIDAKYSINGFNWPSTANNYHYIEVWLDGKYVRTINY